MRKQSYVGHYFVGVPEICDYCNEDDVGECIWQDDANLLCIKYAAGSGGQEVGYSMVVPVRIAKYFAWFKTFAEFYEVVGGEKPDGIVISKRVPNKHFYAVLYHQGIPKYAPCSFSHREVAYLIRHVKEHPESGQLIVDAIIEAKNKAALQSEFVDATVKMIKDAELSDDRLRYLVSRIDPQVFDDMPF